MHTPAIEDSSFGTSMTSSEGSHLTNGHFANGIIASETTRSQSRSTDGTDTTDGSHANTSDVVNGSTGDVASPHQPITNLNMALQHASTLESSHFPSFNNDLFAFQNNSLIPYPMMFGRNGPMSFDTKPDVGQLQQQMQMREAKPYKCTQCVKSFANSSYLSQHMRIHLGIKPFGPCQFCGKKFTQLSHLQQHIRTHTGEKPYKCKYTGCEKAFSQLSNLQSHSRCHQTDKPFKCNSCYKCFTDEQSLLEHIPKHKESKHLKVHICPFCGKSYTQATYLQKHMTKHADRTRNAALGTDIPADHFDSALLGWNPMQGMTDSQHEAQFAINQFAANSMMGAVAGSQSAAYNNPALQNSAFTQLLNFRSNPRYFDYQANIKQSAGERGAGFNMITPLENIQRYSGTATTVASAVHPQFNPQSIINNMKHASY